MVLTFILGLLIGCAATTVVLISTKATDYDDYYEGSDRR